MTKRYLCPRHKENTGSAVVYGDRFFCFGCGQSGPVTELGLEPGEKIQETYVEDLQASIERIRRLPLRPVRGFSLHSHDAGYYLLWPDLSYYKYRSYSGADSHGKYKGPAGHRKPWFKASEGSGETLALVEGEFNAMSLALACPELAVISPGGAGDFYSKGSEKYLQNLTCYEKVFVIADDDKAGAQAAIQATSKLKHYGVKNAQIRLVKEDFNDVHTKEGQEALKAKAREMGM